MAVNQMIYNRKFYEEQRITNASSAEIIYPIIKDIVFKNKVNPSVCDIGCGTGNWLKVFKDNGCKVHGIDGCPWTDELVIDKSEFMQHDLRDKLDLENKYDLALCLEVAEHLPNNMANNLVESLTECSDIILFSAAIPFQMGQGHVNEQYQSYWVKKFEDKGYVVCDCIRPRIWNNKEVRHFYKQNMLLFVKNNEMNKNIISNYETGGAILDIIHPETWEKVQSWLPVKIMVGAYNNPAVYGVYQWVKKVRKVY